MIRPVRTEKQQSKIAEQPAVATINKLMDFPTDKRNVRSDPITYADGIKKMFTDTPR